MVSSHNPFRTPAVTPTPTGALGASPASVGQSSSAEDRGDGGRPPQIDTSVSDLLNEELPPAYTPAPNVYEGEATLEVGPRRPFQQPVQPPQQQNYGPSQFPPPSWGIPPQPTGASSWSAFPGQRRQELYTTPAPPPVHPDLTGIRRPSSTSNAPPGPLSDFARDFYAASGTDSGLYGGASSRYQNEDSDVSSPSSSSGRYAPPPGVPPNRPGKSLPATPTSPTQDGIPNDGRPTDRPVPGHPLLRHGKVLVYPTGFECQKCECLYDMIHAVQGQPLTNRYCQAVTPGIETLIPRIPARGAGTSTQSHTRGPSHMPPGRPTARRPPPHPPPRHSSVRCQCLARHKPRCTSKVPLGLAKARTRMLACHVQRPRPASVRRATAGTPAHQRASCLSLGACCPCRRTLTGWAV